MNHPSNENPKPLGEQTPSAEDDQPLQQFLDRAASEEPNAPAEDPFFSPLPDIDISGDEPEDGVSDDTPDEAPDENQNQLTFYTFHILILINKLNFI